MEPLAALKDRLRACRICEARFAATATAHRPNPVVWFDAGARILIASQAPGLRVHEANTPFWDRSGARLRDWMGVDEATFYDRSRVAIVPMGFCFPGYDAKGSDMPPRRECRATWHDLIFSAMPQIELVLAIGAHAQLYHLGDTKARTMTETVHDWHRHMMRNERPRVLPLPHPSWRNTGWLRRNPWFESEVVPALRGEVARLLQPL